MTRTIKQYDRHPRAAFSLIELVVVIVIIGVMAAVAVPRFASAAGRYRLDAAARRVAADLRLARSTAMSRSANVQFLFDFAGTQYSIYNVQDIDRQGVHINVQLDEDPYHVDLVSVFGTTNGGVSIIFDGFGRPDQGGDIVLQGSDTSGGDASGGGASGGDTSGGDASGGGENRTVRLDADHGVVTLP